MKPIIIGLFNNKGGVGKTSVVYHLAHIFPRIGYPTLAVDLDPQANLTSAFFDEEALSERLENPKEGGTIYSCIEPIMEGTGDIAEPQPEKVADGVFVLCGDLGLSLFEDKLSDAWPRTYEGDMGALRATTSFYRIMLRSAEKCGVKIVLVDVGPNLGAINRAAILSVDYLVLPLAVDLFSLQGLRNLGPTVRKWRKNWEIICQNNPNLSIIIPSGKMEPIGYLVLQHAMRLDRPVLSYNRWLNKIPKEYWEFVLNKQQGTSPDSECVGTLRHYRSMMPMAQEARKPVFDLLPADGALGGHGKLVQTAYKEFKSLAEEIIKRLLYCGEKGLLEGLKRIDEFRKEITFLTIDVVGSTKIKEGGKDTDIDYTFIQYHKYVEEIAGKNNGDVVWSGDGGLCAFQNPDKAVESAIRIQEGLSDFNQNEERNKLEKPIMVRIGINTGVCLVDEAEEKGKWTGVAIDIAGHLQKYSEPGEIRIGEETYKKLTDKTNFKEDKSIDGVKTYLYQIRRTEKGR